MSVSSQLEPPAETGDQRGLKAPRLRRQIPAGMIDSGAASLATFAVGIFALQTLDKPSFGVYALFFSAFMLSPTLVTDLVFVPAYVEILALPLPQRLRMYRQTLRVGLVPTLLAAAVVLIAVIPARGDGPSPVIWPLAITALVGAVLSPLQNNLRRLLYLAGRPWYAAVVSLVMLTGTAAALGAALLTDVEPAYVPFGALAVGNAVSLVVAFVIAERLGEAPPARLLDMRKLMRAGRWLVVVAAAPAAATFVASALVHALAGPDILALAEAARLAGRPLTVMVLGISAVITPAAMEAGRDRDGGAGRKLTRASDLLVLAATLGYVAIVGHEWFGNPMQVLTPLAYEVPWLVVVSVLAAGATAAMFAQKSQLVGGSRETELAAIEVSTAVLIIAGALTVGVTLAFALALGQVARSVARWLAYRSALNRHYGGGGS